MSALQETQAWLAAIEKGGLRPPELRVVTADPPQALNPSDVEALLGDLPVDTEGWVCLTDSIWIRGGGAWTWVSGSADQGFHPRGALVLSAELLLPPGKEGALQQSLHLRRRGGSLQMWRYTEGPGRTHLVFDESFRSTEQGRRLAYRVAWRQAPMVPNPGGLEIPVWRPWIARFAGWRS